ncbi:sideroflexin-4 isoform X2 [Antennarius striatus]|uniref:sideroflexin-4 isoform X2 n=1 Tax=Antennarius striatus TaxID=241820 RepID=UPI0035B346E4
MDPNLLYWKVHGQSFFSRLKIWADVLDPLLLLSSGGEIQKAHTRLGSGEKLSEQDAHLPNLSLSAVHADSGATLPLPFRPPAFLLMSMPLVLCSSLPHKNVTPALFWQFVLQSYSARFNFIHGNSTSQQKASLNGLLLIAGTVSYTTCAGALPQIIINRLNIRIPSVQNFFRTALPVPLSALLAFANVYTVRSEETDTGIKVYDSNGNQVGFSKAAGVKVKFKKNWNITLNFSEWKLKCFLCSGCQRDCFVQSSDVRDNGCFSQPAGSPVPEKSPPGQCLKGHPSEEHGLFVCSGLDDPHLLQSLSTTRNDKEGNGGRGAADCSGRRTALLPQRTLSCSTNKSFHHHL